MNLVLRTRAPRSRWTRIAPFDLLDLMGLPITTPHNHNTYQLPRPLISMATSFPWTPPPSISGIKYRPLSRYTDQSSTFFGQYSYDFTNRIISCTNLTRLLHRTEDVACWAGNLFMHGCTRNASHAYYLTLTHGPLDNLGVPAVSGVAIVVHFESIRFGGIFAGLGIYFGRSSRRWDEQTYDGRIHASATYTTFHTSAVQLTLSFTKKTCVGTFSNCTEHVHNSMGIYGPATTSNFHWSCRSTCLIPPYSDRSFAMRDEIKAVRGALRPKARRMEQRMVRLCRTPCSSHREAPRRETVIGRLILWGSHSPQSARCMG